MTLQIWGFVANEQLPHHPSNIVLHCKKLCHITVGPTLHVMLDISP